MRNAIPVDPNEFRAAVLMLTYEQMRQTWQREQTMRVAAGQSHYERLIDVATGKVVARISR